MSQEINCMVFSAGFDIISFKLQQTVHLFMLSWTGFTSSQYNILSNALAAFPHNICQKMDSGKTGMNSTATIIINPRKKFWLT